MKHKEKGLRDLFWNAASCGDMYTFNKSMKELHQSDPAVAKWLMVVGPKFWARSHFTPQSRSDVLVNNLNESWNNYILEAREEGIVNMLEWIRRKLMKRFQIKKERMEKYAGPIGPRIQKKNRKTQEIYKGLHST